MSVRGDVGPMIDAWQGQVPLMYSSAGTLPDEASLASWMQKMLDTSGGLLMFKGRSADPLWDRTVAWLKAEGVDVDRELARVTREGEYKANRSREAADRATSVAIDLRKAERALLAESRGFTAGCAGFTRNTLAEARERVAELEAALEEACLNDRQLARSVRRAAR